MNQWQQLLAPAMPPLRVKGWRGAHGRGLCKRCGELKLAHEFATATGRICIECDSSPVRDVLGRFTKSNEERK
jgi:hypothetical protein